MTDHDEVIAEARGVSQRYPGVVALDGVDFAIRRGEVRALLGQNGAGKSTLIRLLSGVEGPTSGEILVGGESFAGAGVREAMTRGVATCYQELSLVADLSVAENLFLGRWPRGRFGIDRGRMTRKARTLLADLGVAVDPEAIVGSLTLAQQQLVEIARALGENPKLLILDEPTSALAAAEVGVVLAAVRRVAALGVAVIYVSHRMDEIRQVAASATIMRNGRVVDTVQVAELDTASIVRIMVGSELPARRGGDRRPVGEVVLEVSGLAVPPKLTDVSFTLRRGEILGIAGLLGSGRTELLRALAGWLTPTAGSIRLDGEEIAMGSPERMRRLGVGLTPEDRKREGVLLGLGVDENIVISDFARVSRAGVLSASAIRRAAQVLAERLRIKAADVTVPIGTLSGGNQQKAVIARWLHADTEILLLDEPTRGVDVEAKAQIYAIMREVADDGKAVVFVSSEIEELPLACDRVLVLRDGLIRHESTAPDLDVAELLEAAMAEGR